MYKRQKEDEEFVVALGGKGGFGNTRFKSSTNRAPKKFTKGLKGEEYWIWLQLKTIADIGIIGLPNAGKSSLLASLTRAKPKIANYKFTTLNPNLGVSVYDDKEITLADIPGLIEGAHEGSGLGIKFLKHIERCKTLLHLIDITEENLIDSYRQVRIELKKYSRELEKKKEIVVFNKIDLIDVEAHQIIGKKLKRSNQSTVAVSALTGEGLELLLNGISNRLSVGFEMLDINLKPADGATLAWLYRNGNVIERQDGEEAIRLRVHLAPSKANQFQRRRQL